MFISRPRGAHVDSLRIDFPVSKLSPLITIRGFVVRIMRHSINPYLDPETQSGKMTSNGQKEGASSNYNTFNKQKYTGESGCYFRDGKRKIDYVIVYRIPASGPEPKHLEYREKFLANLRKSQMEMEEEICEDKEGKLHFIKCHCPFEVMKFYAEEMCFPAPLEVRTNDRSNWSEKFFNKFKLPNFCKQDVPNPPPDYMTTAFRGDKMNRFIGSQDPDNYFTDTQRSRVAYEILETAPYGKKFRGEIGINRLIAEKIMDAAYCLHVGGEKVEAGQDPISYNKRQVLKQYWGRFGVWLKYQPLHHIRDYFGEKIGLYFAWLGPGTGTVLSPDNLAVAMGQKLVQGRLKLVMGIVPSVTFVLLCGDLSTAVVSSKSTGQYTAWLVPPSLVGLIVFLFGLLTINSSDNQPALDACNLRNWTFKMCPVCDEDLGCQYYDLGESCTYLKISYLFDNGATLFFAFFMSFWAVFFLEFWKRKQVTLSYMWDCMEYQAEEERPRPTFAALAPTVERNPITGEREPYFPPEQRKPRIYSGMLIIATMVSLVLIFLVGVNVYKLLIFRPLAMSKSYRGFANAVSSSTGAMLSLIFIMILSKVYEKIALALTHWEMHRTQTEYEDSLTFKVFVFQFVNFYSSIFYIAFFKGKLIGYPGHYKRLLGLRQEECGPGGCLIELAQQLFIIMVGKQMIGNIQEVAIPLIKMWLKRWMRGVSADDETTRWEQDYELEDFEGLFGEYLEMVIQFGFITIFVAAFPIAPFFALLNNIFEIRIDANKLISETRRPISERAQDIGIWYNILDSVVKIAVVSNAFLIAFSSEFLPKLLYRYTISEDYSLRGYLNYSLAWAPANTTLQPCRYRDFRNESGETTTFYWNLIALKFGFVILFEHFVFFVQKLIDLVVPDIPQELDIRIKREAYLSKKAMADTQRLGVGNETGDELDDRHLENI